MKRYVLAGLCLTAMLAGILSAKVFAGHLPITTPIKWDNTHLKRMWATSFPDDIRRTLVRQINDHNTSCYASTCDDVGGWARWYISDSYPHIDLADSATRPNYSIYDTKTVCDNPDYRVSFHIEALRSDTQEGVTPLGVAQLCPYSYTEFECVPIGDILTQSTTTTTQNQVNCPKGTVPQVKSHKEYLAAGAVAFNTQTPPGTSWSYSGAYESVPSNQFAFVGTLAHEMGHIFNLGHYTPDAQGYSTDSACTQNNDNRGERYANRGTMCVPAYPGQIRKLTPEQDEKDTFKNFYKP